MYNISTQIKPVRVLLPSKKYNYFQMNKIILILLTVISFTTASAQIPKDHNAQVKTDTFSRSLLWRISGNGLHKPSWLFGTIHMICPEDYFWTDSMKACLQKSEAVCFEMNLDDPSVMIKAAASMIDSSGKKLSDYFTDEQNTQLAKYLNDSLGLQIAMFQSMKPIALDVMLTSKNMSCPNPESYEDNILEQAKKDNKIITGLEEVKEQIDVLSSIPTDSVISDILTSIKGGASDKNNYDEIVAAYKQQDLSALFYLIQQSNDLGNDIGIFLDDRNKKWISRIEEKIQKQSVFFAVGAGHLWGPNGVISLLRKEGYRVEPVK